MLEPLLMTARSGRDWSPDQCPRHCCVEVAWALQPFDNGYATDLQEGNLLEWW